MYTIIQTIEEAILNKKQQIKFNMEEMSAIDRRTDQIRKEVAGLDQELRQLKDVVEQGRQATIDELNRGAAKMADRAFM